MTSRALAAALAAALPALAGAAARPVYGGEIVIALPAPPRELDPSRATDPADVAAVRALHAAPLGVDASGALVPALLAEVPAAEAGGRVFRLRLRPGLRFADGSPLGAADVAAAIGRLAAPGSRHGWLAIAIEGAADALAGRAPAPRGIRVVSDREIVVELELPVPEFAWALAAIPAAPTSPRGAGAGPFRPAGPPQAPGRLALVANEHSPRGRPFADRLVLAAPQGRTLAAALERGEVHLALRPDAAGRSSVPLPAATAVYAAVNARRLGAGAEAVRRTLAGLDRAELARRFVRGPSEPLAHLLPAWIFRPPPGAGGAEASAPSPPQPAAPGPPAPGPAPPRLSLLVPAGAPEARAAADRIQVKLFDAGIRATVEEADAARFAARLAAGEHEVAIVPVGLFCARPALAAAQVAWTVAGPRAAREALQAIAGRSGDEAIAAADAVGARLGLVPLFAWGPRASAGPALEGVAPRPDGAIDPGDLWLRRGAAP